MYNFSENSLSKYIQNFPTFLHSLLAELPLSLTWTVVVTSVRHGVFPVSTSSPFQWVSPSCPVETSQLMFFAQTPQKHALSISSIHSPHSDLQHSHDVPTTQLSSLTPCSPIFTRLHHTGLLSFLVCAKQVSALERGLEPRSLRSQSLFLNPNNLIEYPQKS